MEKSVTLVLDKNDVGQILDALIERAEVWKKTADYLSGGSVDEEFVVEECRDEDEAREIAERYAAIIDSIRNQMISQA